MARTGKAPLCAAALAALIPGVASADISENIFVIQAANAYGTAIYVAHFGDGQMDHSAGTYNWALNGCRMLQSQSGNTIAMLNEAALVGHEDPSVTLSFNVFAGSVETTFTITSATVSFTAINNAQGRTSASVSVTDLNGDGVAMHTAGGNPGAFTAFYNGAPPAGTTFSSLFAAPAATPISGGTATDAQNFPTNGSFMNIAGAVTNISSRFQFTLSPNDMASGTSVFTVQPVPAPGALALVGVAGLLFARRRAR